MPTTSKCRRPSSLRSQTSLPACRGKAAVGAYWAKALEIIPDLHFESIAVLTGVDSIVLHYRGARGRLAAEVFQFGADGKILKAFAHYVR